MDATSAPDSNHEDESNLSAAEVPAESDETTALAAPAPAEEPPAPPAIANVGRRRPDQVALALLAGIVVLLLICVVIALIAWRHAPVNPAIPAAYWRPLG